MILGMMSRILSAAPASGDFELFLYTGDGTTFRQLGSIDCSNGGFFISASRENSAGKNLFFESPSGTYSKKINSSTTSTASSDSVFNSSGVLLGSGTLDQESNISGVGYVGMLISYGSDTASCVDYTGNGSARAIAHGLSTTPEVCLCVSRSRTTMSIPYLNNSEAGLLTRFAVNNTPASGDFWNSLPADSSVVNIGTELDVNESSSTFSLISAGGDIVQQRVYTGNGSTAGPVVDFGWQPEAVIIKQLTGGSGAWNLLDQLRSPGFSGNDLAINMATISNEANFDRIALATNGIQMVTTNVNFNGNGSRYLALGFRSKP